MSIRIPWDKYEVALLIEACEKVHKNKMKKSQAITQISKTLRKLAIIRGYTIDDVFRNENGISMQFAVANGLIGNKSSNLTEAKIFKDIAEIYNTDKAKFNLILTEAYEMLNNQTSFIQADNISEQLELNNYYVDHAYSKNVIEILSKRYRYGFRIDSIIEYIRFRNYAEEYDIALPDDDCTLKREILHVGVVIDNKLYVISERTIDELYEIIYSVMGNGVQIIYYESLMARFSKWMSDNYIFSINMLKELLKIYCKSFYYSKNFFSTISKLNENDAILMELRRIWSKSAIMEINSIAQLLPYIPYEKIKWYISVNYNLVWSSKGVYLLLDKFIISDLEAENIMNYVITSCKNNGFASLNDVPLGSIEEENYEVSITAIYNAIYYKVLKDKFILNGKILTINDKKSDVVTILKQYCVNKDECTFEEIHDRVKELIGTSNRRYAFLALYDTMIRVDKNRFVADKYVNFDIEKIDALISEFITDRFTAIKNITTFAMFPICGQNWNHYLLESYCYRFSNEYVLRLLSFNDKNSGIIAEKSLDMNYYDMLAKTVAKTNIILNVENVGRYLCDNGYLAKSKTTGIDDILNKAAIIRERK